MKKVLLELLSLFSIVTLINGASGEYRMIVYDSSGNLLIDRSVFSDDVRRLQKTKSN